MDAGILIVEACRGWRDYHEIKKFIGECIAPNVKKQYTKPDELQKDTQPEPSPGRGDGPPDENRAARQCVKTHYQTGN